MKSLESQDKTDKQAKWSRTITPQEEVFVSEFVKSFNAPLAARKAGYAKRTAGSALLFLRRPRVRNRLLELVASIQNKNRRTAEWVLSRLEHLADITSDENGPHYNARNAIRALELLGKYHKLFTEKVEISIREDLGDKIMDARRRASVTLTETTEIDSQTGNKTITKMAELIVHGTVEDYLK